VFCAPMKSQVNFAVIHRFDSVAESKNLSGCATAVITTAHTEIMDTKNTTGFTRKPMKRTSRSAPPAALSPACNSLPGPRAPCANAHRKNQP
jgi:hypothetical protein